MIETDRLLVRPPVEDDRARFVELFTDEAFTVWSGGVHDVASANERFDGMLVLADAVPYAKQPVIKKDTGTIVGYSGVGTVVFEGLDRLEWGWRFVPAVRGKGYATEATKALLDLADSQGNGEMLCIIATGNNPSMRVAEKAGFHKWRTHVWDEAPGQDTQLLLRSIGAGGEPMLAPNPNG